MKTNELIRIIKPGDILLTKNPAGLGNLINWAQMIGQGDKSFYGHVAIIVRNPSNDQIDGTIAESVMKISYQHVSNYKGNKICIMRHKKMTAYRYNKGMPEVEDNIGQIYPAHRLIVHLADALRAWTIRKISFGKIGRPWFRYAKFLRFDWPVCSELAAQFLIAAGVETGLPFDGWRGINPDHFDDTRLNNPELWKTIYIDKLI
ncbi:hypothetical protein KAR91_63885 [Candidatus Pacearchaeota archaeon]|nr:hypothetical protein [Candidatus Pacearchaeota archaeon]